MKLELSLWVKVVMTILTAQTTEFVPDEYWQSTEVASHLHGNGHLTWEWEQGLRSYVVPLIISWMYKIGSWVGLDHDPGFLTLGPQLLQLALTLYAYSFFPAFARARIGNQGADIAYNLLIMNWFATFCGARLIINQTEMSLNLIALWLLTEEHWKRFVVVVGINFMIRPTAAIFWVPFIPEVLEAMVKNRRGTVWQKYSTVISSSLVGVLVLGLGALLDYVMTGRLSWWEFFKFNFMEDGNAEFGVHPPFWYFYSAIPSILGPVFFFLGIGLHVPGQTQRLTWYTAFYLFVYSYLPHKEIRFLLPVLPLMLCVLGSVIVTLNNLIDRLDQRAFGSSNFKLWPVLAKILIVLNIATGVYFGFFHQSGIRPATQFIHSRIKTMPNPNVWILTPCYNVPVHTYVPHPNATYEYYICSPARFHHLYDNKTELFQSNGFGTVNLAADIQMKLATKPAPDYVLAFEPSVPTILEAFRTNLVPLEVRAIFRHTFASDAPRFVYVLGKLKDMDMNP